jgi:hypothetical protein
MYIDGDSILQYTQAMFPPYNWQNICSRLLDARDYPLEIQEGELITTGEMKYIGGIDLDKPYSIVNSINSQYYVVEAKAAPEDDAKLTPVSAENGYEIIFNPFTEQNSQILAFANVMAFVPYIIYTDDDGNTYMNVKQQYFLLHNKFSTDNVLQLVGVQDGSEYTQATLANESHTHYGLLNSNNPNYKRYYYVAYNKTYSQDHHIPININTIDSEIKFFYKANFPVTMRLALTGSFRILNVLKFPGMGKLHMLNLKNVLKNSDFSIVNNFKIFNTSLKDIYSTVENEFSAQDSTYPIVMFVNPFYRWGLDDYIEFYASEDSLFDDKDRKKLSCFGVHSSGDGTVKANAICTFLNTNSTWYATWKGSLFDKQPVPDLAAFEFKDFT